MSQPISPPQANNLEPESPRQPPPVMMSLPHLVPLYKQRSWSPDIYREEAWLRRKGNNKKGRSKSVTDEDLDELKGCIELGFGFEFDSPELAQRLAHTFPALGLYCNVNKNYCDAVSRSASSPSAASHNNSIPSPVGSPRCQSHTMFGPVM